MIQDQIEIDLATMKDAENVDRIASIQQILRQILFSVEVSPHADVDGEWSMDFDWEAELGKVTMKKVVRPAYRAQATRTDRTRG